MGAEVKEGGEKGNVSCHGGRSGLQRKGGGGCRDKMKEDRGKAGQRKG